jgi:small-conductance mechanosensitive channel
MLSTKILTRKREEITIPNAVLVGTRTVNYSRHVAGVGTRVGTTVTIGYDAPWRLVHAMLLDSAKQTAGVRKEPIPVVLQRALSHFYVEYELIFSVDNPEERAPILSELHQNIQDAFNERGVQIMSPHYEGQPSQPVVVPRARWSRAPGEAERPGGG